MKKERKPYFKSVRLPVAPPGHTMRSDKDYNRRTGKLVPDTEGEENEQDIHNR